MQVQIGRLRVYEFIYFASVTQFTVRDLVTMARGAFSLCKTEMQFYMKLSNIYSTELTLPARDLATYSINNFINVLFLRRYYLFICLFIIMWPKIHTSNSESRSLTF